MARRQSREDKPRRPFRFRLLAVLTPLALLLVVAGLLFLYQDRWLGSGEGRYAEVERRLTPEEELAEAVVLGAREMGVPRRRIARRPGPEGQARFEFRCPDRLHPISANRWLHRIFVDAGVEVLACREEGKLHRPSLHYELAAGPMRQARASLLVLPPIGEPPLRDAWPRLAIIVDDLGHHYGRRIRDVLDLGLPLTASILPNRRASRRVEEEARRRGHAIFLHLPMEPLDYPNQDSGAGTLFADMTPDSIRILLAENAAGFRALDGFNNHMGSRACQVDSVVGPILDWAASRGLIVVDSQTTAKSRIYDLGRQRHLPTLKVDRFLDGEGEDEGQVMENLAAAVEIARRRGWALAICHPRPATLRALKRMAPRLRDYDLHFVTVPQLLKDLGGANPAPPTP